VVFRKLDQLDSAVELADLVNPLVIDWKDYRETEKGSTVSELTINTEYVLFGLNLVQ